MAHQDPNIGGTKYALYREVVDGILCPSWKRTDSLQTQAGDLLAVKEWANGWAAGMGYSVDVANVSDAYAFSTGFDCHNWGFARLAGYSPAITSLTYSPTDAPTWIEEIAPSGGFVNSVSNFTTSNDTSAHSITHGLSVAPKAIIFWTAGQTVSGTVAAGTFGSYGFTDGTTSRVAGWNAEDNVATANTSRQWASGVVCLPTAAGAAGPIATVSNVGTSTFDVTFDSAPSAGIIVHFIAIGGAEVSAKVLAWTKQAGTGNQSTTGVGFQPTMAMHLSVGLTSLSAFASTNLQLGTMDSTGNQWAISFLSTDAVTPSNSERYQSTAATIASTAGGTVSNRATYVSMDNDGFTVNWAVNSGSVPLYASLCLKGVRVKAGSTTKKTSSGNQAAETIGFTTTGFMVFSTGVTASATVTDNALFAVGGASGTTAVEAMCWSDEDAQNPSDTYSVDDNALAMEIIDLTDGTEDNLATCGAISMETAGWLTWSAADANAAYISYLAFAPLAAATSFIYVFNGQHSTKLSVSGTTITQVEAKDFGAAASCGFGAIFKGVIHLPLGTQTNAQRLATVAQSGGTDTWTSDGFAAVAFATQQDGPTAKIAKGYCNSGTVANLVDLSSDGTTYAGNNYEVGDTSDSIVKMVDTGTDLYIAKERNLWRADPTVGTAQQVTSESSKTTGNGVGTVAVQGTHAVFYNHDAKDFFFDGGQRPQDLGVDSIPFNDEIANVTHAPVSGQYLESTTVGNWKYALYRVTESSSDKTFIEARQYIDGRWIHHSYIRRDGVVRGLFVDSAYRLWYTYATGGSIGFYQLGKDGSPNAARDSIGYGEASTTYYLYMPEIILSGPDTTNQLWQLAVNVRNIDSTCPITLVCFRDGSTEETVSSTITTSGVSYRYWTNGTNDTTTRVRFALKMVTTSGYTPSSADPQIWFFGARAYPRPNKEAVYKITIDTLEPWMVDGIPDARSLVAATTQRTNLAALVSAAPVACVDPDGNSVTLRFTDVGDVRLMPDPDNAEQLHYVIDTTAISRSTF